MVVADSNGSDQPEGALECVIDLDCGITGYGDYICEKNFVVRDYHIYRCVGVGSRNATCVNETKRDAYDLCRPDEVCEPGKRICQPLLPLLVQKPVYANCDYDDLICQCSNGIKDVGETGVDCGGSCKSCVIECVSNSSCGIPRWNPPYCGGDGSVYQDYVAYACVDPGTIDSYCRHDRTTRRSDYCGPTNVCVRGRCVDDDDREPYAYLDGGHFGSNRTRLSQEYVCQVGDSCYTLDQGFSTCVGTSCYLIKPMDGEDKGPVGLK
ncbi:MAG: hypothetical protein V1875_10325 [Candidatus Altiarchaeota archaeon]